MTTPTLDRILHVSRERAEGVRNVPSTLAVFDTHFPRFPVLPGVMILETMAELAATLLQDLTGSPWTLLRAERVRYRHFVRPGDQLVAEVVLTTFDASEAVLGAAACVDGAKVATVRALTMVPT